MLYKGNTLAALQVLASASFITEIKYARTTLALSIESKATILEQLLVGEVRRLGDTPNTLSTTVCIEGAGILFTQHSAAPAR